MQTLLPIATEIASLLKARAQTIAVAESAAGGLIAAALLAVPGRPTSSAAQSSTPACRAPCCSASPMRRCEGFVHRRSRTPRCWRERRANASAPIGPSPRPARQGRPAIATGTMPVTVAARSRWQWRCPIHHDRYREHRPPSQHARLRESRARTASSPVVVVAAGHGRSGIAASCWATARTTQHRTRSVKSNGLREVAIHRCDAPQMPRVGMGEDPQVHRAILQLRRQRAQLGIVLRLVRRHCADAQSRAQCGADRHQAVHPIARNHLVSAFDRAG